MGMKRTGINKVCEQCGSEYYVPGWRLNNEENPSKFCSMKCMYAGRPKTPRKGLLISCEHCAKEVYIPQGRKDTAKYCSQSCKAFANPQIQAMAAKAAGEALRGTGFSEEEKKRRKRERDRLAYLKNRDQRLEYGRQRYQENKEAHAEAGRIWREENREQANFISQRRKHRLRSAEGNYTCEDIDRIREDQKGLCAYCSIKMQKKSGPAKETIDHIVAVSKGGTNWPSNLQLVCKSCNSKKHNKDPLDFAREIGRLL